MAQEACLQSSETSPVKNTSMAIFSMCSVGQFSTNYNQSYDAPKKESHKTLEAVSFHPKPNPRLTDPNRNFGLDVVNSLYKSSFVGGGKEEWFSQLPAFAPVHADTGSSGPFCGSSTARDSYLNSGNNAELHKRNTADAKINKNRGRVAQTNPRPYAKYLNVLCYVCFVCVLFCFHWSYAGMALWHQVHTDRISWIILPPNLPAKSPANYALMHNVVRPRQHCHQLIWQFHSCIMWSIRWLFTVASAHWSLKYCRICLKLWGRWRWQVNKTKLKTRRFVDSLQWCQVTNSLLSMNFNAGRPDITISACWFRHCAASTVSFAAEGFDSTSKATFGDK